MKPALVLGLALAANAMTADQGDNELVVAPTDQFGNIREFYPHIRFDEQADDELLVRPPIRPTYLQVADDELLSIKKPREESKMTEAYKKSLFGEHYRPISAQFADDELIIAPTDEFGRIKPYPRNIKFDEQADDELIVAPTDEFGRIKHYPPYIRFDEDGNEFFVAPTHRLGEVGHRILYDDELAARAGEMKELLETGFEYKGRLDDEADAELMMAPLDGTGKFNKRRFDHVEARKVYDDEADTELMMALYKRGFDHVEARKVYDDADDELMRAPYDRRRFDHVEGRKVYDDEADLELVMAPYKRGFDHVEGRKVYDDEADTELMMAPLDGTGKYNRRRFDDLATRKVYDDEADTELMMAPYRRGFDHVEGRKVYDDADDELLVRPVSIQIADDELIRAPTDDFGKIKRFPGHIMYDEQADDELFKREDRQKPPTMGPKLFVERQHPVVKNDDEADNELVSKLFPLGTQHHHHHEQADGMKPTLFARSEPVVSNDDELVYLGELMKHHKMDRFRDHELPEIKTRKPVSAGFLAL